MRFAWIGVGVAAMLPTAIVAQTTTTARQGVWESYSGRSADGTAMCGATSRGPDRSFHIKFFDDANFLTIQIFKDGWRIPPNTTMRIRMTIDNHQGWQVASAIGDGRMIEWRIPGGLFEEFSNLFMAGRRMIIFFPDGSEAPWETNLTGSSAIFTEFMRCSARLITARTPTQPFGITPRSQPTQPFRDTLTLPGPSTQAPPSSPQIPKD